MDVGITYLLLVADNSIDIEKNYSFHETVKCLINIWKCWRKRPFSHLLHVWRLSYPSRLLQPAVHGCLCQCVVRSQLTANSWSLHHPPRSRRQNRRPAAAVQSRNFTAAAMPAIVPFIVPASVVGPSETRKACISWTSSAHYWFNRSWPSNTKH